jgi:hypothetical protein
MNAEVRARWIAGPFLLLTLVALVVLAARSPSAAPAAVAQVEGVSCQMKEDGPTVQELMEQVIQQRMRNGGDEEPDYVVLNNRGYNYGPAPGVDFDSLMVDVAAQNARER